VENLKETSSTILGVKVKHELVKIGEIVLHVTTAGPEQGEPIILLHGFPDYWKTWQYQVPALVNAGYRLIIPDQRGFNLSSKPKGVNNYHISSLSNDITALLDHFGYEQCRLVGHDWGGMVAWQLLSDNSKRLQQVVILNAPHIKTMQRLSIKSATQILKSWYVYVFQIPFVAEKLLYPIMIRWVNKRYKTGNDDNYTNAMMQSDSAISTIGLYRSAFRSIFSRIGIEKIDIKVPVLLLWASSDIALSKNLAKESIAYCSRGKLEVLKNTTHWSHMDAPDVVTNKILSEFKRGG